MNKFTKNNNNNNNMKKDKSSFKLPTCRKELLICGCGSKLRTSDEQYGCDICEIRYVVVPDKDTLDALRDCYQSLKSESLNHKPKLRRVLATIAPGAVLIPFQRQAIERSWSMKWTGELASTVYPRGSYVKGFKGAPEGAKLWYTDYQLTVKQLEWLHKEYPNTWFVTGDDHHDHPLSHITCQMATGKLWTRIDGEDKLVLDLHGNPQANLRANRKCTVDTVVERVTPKDFVRAATKWGDWEQHSDRVFEAPMRDICVLPTGEWKGRIANYSDFTSIHTLYYYSREEIAHLLKHRKNARLHAVVHKHTGNSGSLFNGEQAWTRSTVMGRDRIEQVNKMTGEQYEHPSLDWVFSGAQSWSSDELNLGFGWTLNKIAAETYLVTFVPVPVAQTRMDVKLDEAKKNSVVEKLGVDVNGTFIDCPCAHMPTVVKAGAVVSLKARTGQQFKDHLSLVKRLLKEAGTQDADIVRDTAILSFFGDIEADRTALQSLYLSSAVRADLRRTLDGTKFDTNLGVLKQALAVAVVGLESGNVKKGVAGVARWFSEQI